MVMVRHCEISARGVLFLEHCYITIRSKSSMSVHMGYHEVLDEFLKFIHDRVHRVFQFRFSDNYASHHVPCLVL
jgi:hypothetical protein